MKVVMEQGAVGGGARAPLRGTQSFVGVMTTVWKRPSLTAMELLWRWTVGAVFAALAWHFGGVALGTAGMEIHTSAAALSSMTALRPVESLATLDAFLAVVVPVLWPVVRWLAPAYAVVWVIASGLGRGLMLRRMDGRLASRPGTLVVLAAGRVVSLLAALGLWVWICRWAVRTTIVERAARHREPNVVGGFALIVTSALVLFLLWCMVSWVLRIAPVAAMARNEGAAGSVRVALRSGPARGKLIEINMVMGIVRVALIVLTMVFSACPLPFEEIATKAFLSWWWLGMVLLFLAESDYFQVVREAAYLAMWRGFEIVPPDTAAEAGAAS